jgi:hydroxylamine reductase (hybrid-cluster protein)
VTGGKLAIETDPVEAVGAMLAWIDEKRAALGI